MKCLDHQPDADQQQQDDDGVSAGGLGLVELCTQVVAGEGNSVVLHQPE